MDCKMTEELILTDYIDGKLAPQALKEIEAHLASCGACRGLVSELKALNASFTGLKHKEPPFEVWERIRARIVRKPVADAAENIIDVVRFVFARLRLAAVVVAAAVLILAVLAVARMMPRGDMVTQEDMLSFVNLGANGEYDEYDFDTFEEDYFL